MGVVKIVEVTADGIVCPSGSWNASILEDGEQLTVDFDGWSNHFDQLVLRGDRSRLEGTRCRLTVKLDAEDGVSYAPAELRQEGVSTFDASEHLGFDVDYRWDRGESHLGRGVGLALPARALRALKRQQDARAAQSATWLRVTW